MKIKTNKPLITICPNCGNELSYFRTCRYLESGEAVCDCRQCGRRIKSSDKDKKKNKQLNVVKDKIGGEPHS